MNEGALSLLALLLPLAVAAGLDLPLLLLLPWLLSLVPGMDPTWVDAMGGIASPLPAALGAALLGVRRLLRGVPWAAPGLEVLIAGAGALVAFLLPWLLSPAAASPPFPAALVTLGVATTVGMIRLGCLALERHAPGALRVPGTGVHQARVWRWLPPAATATLLVLLFVTPAAEAAEAQGLLPLGAAVLLFLVLLGAGWQGFRAAVHLLGLALRGVFRLSPPRSASGARQKPAALLGDGPSGVRWGVLHWNDPGSAVSSFRYRSLAGSWEMELEAMSRLTVEPGPLFRRVTMIDPSEAPSEGHAGPLEEDPSERRVFLTATLVA